MEESAAAYALYVLYPFSGEACAASLPEQSLNLY